MWTLARRALLSSETRQSRAHRAESPSAAGDLPADVDLLTRQLLLQRRYCRLLSADEAAELDDRACAAAWKSLEEDMALVPAGQAALARLTFGEGEEPGDRPADVRLIAVQAFYVDRFAVTNADFARFVEAGGYRDPKLWPAEILPVVLRFVDSTGAPGPRFWAHGTFPPRKRLHPVVGISWFEANAYARWVGKQVPTPARWQRAATWWSVGGESGEEARYPWGNTFEPSRANTWAAGMGDTVPVDHYYAGCTPNGVYQLSGNVWEWVTGVLDDEGDREGQTLVFNETMAEIRGGAYDTYFETQATSYFRSGQPLLYRGANVGFRCSMPLDLLASRPELPENHREGLAP
jgi:iron(II)-dependent oxidoreductase